MTSALKPALVLLLIALVPAATSIGQEAGREKIRPGTIRGASPEILAAISAGRQLRNRGEHEAALAALEDALQKARAAGDKSGQAWAMNNIASVYRYDATAKRSAELSRRAADLYEQTRVFALAGGDKHNAAYATLYLGVLALEQGEAKQASKLLEVALPLFQEVDDPYYSARSYVYLGRAAISQKEPVKALSYFEQALPMYREAELWDQAAVVTREMAAVYEQLARPAPNAAKPPDND
jgi:tetratricopeptide (TPR) repeat protein